MTVSFRVFAFLLKREAVEPVLAFPVLWYRALYAPQVEEKLSRTVSTTCPALLARSGLWNHA